MPHESWGKGKKGRSCEKERNCKKGGEREREMCGNCRLEKLHKRNDVEKIKRGKRKEIQTREGNRQMGEN